MLFPAPRASKGSAATVWKNWTSDLGAKSLSFVVAVALWYTVTSKKEFVADLVFPIEYEAIPTGISAVEKLPTEVRARVRGNGKFLAFHLRNGVYRVDLSDTHVGTNTILLEGRNLDVPAEWVRTREILEPRVIRAEFDETVVREVPIEPTVVGAPAAKHLQVGKTFVNPPTARVRGPRRIVDATQRVTTEGIDIEGQRSTFSKHVRLLHPVPETLELAPPTVEITITIEPVIAKKIENLVLEFAELQPGWQGVFQPSLLQVEISGAKSLVEAAAKEVSSIIFRAGRWSLGTSILRFKEVRGRDIVYAPYETFPLVAAPSWEDSEGPPPVGPSGPPTRKVSPAVRTEVVGSLPLPPDIEIIHIEPERLVAKVRLKGAGAAPVHDSDPSP